MDLLSFRIFCIFEDCLSKLLHILCISHKLDQISFTHSCKTHFFYAVTHFFYADDILLCCRNSIKNARALYKLFLSMRAFQVSM